VWLCGKEILHTPGVRRSMIWGEFANWPRKTVEPVAGRRPLLSLPVVAE